MSFSVVIPLHQGEQTVVRAVASVLGQTSRPAEVVVVDDGSTDTGPDLVRHSFPTVKVIEQPNQGGGAARNAGINASTADWVALLDADDYWLPWHLEHLAAMVSAFPEARMVAGAFAPLRPGESNPPIRRGQARQIDYFQAAARNSGVVHSSTAAIRCDVFADVAGFGNARLGEDLAMWAKVALVSPVVASSATSAVYALGLGVTAAAAREAQGREPPPATTELAELSPSAAVVVEALANGTHLPPARSLRRYLDSRVAWAVRTRIAAGDIEGAKATRELASSTPWPESAVPMIVSALPTAAIRGLLAGKRALGGVPRG